MSRLYPHTIVVTRPNPVDSRSTDTESGQPIGDPPTDVTVYSGECRYTAYGAAVRRAGIGVGVDRATGGLVDVTGDAIVQIRGTPAVFNTETDTAVVTANGVTFTARIIRPDYQPRQTVLTVTAQTTPVAA